jgi:hypothetical protein
MKGADMKTLYATVDDHLLSEIPRFFGSLEVALTEIFQNAYRAGAQHVTVTWDEGARMLSMADDGPGLADPGILLVAGRSDWDGHVIEPAGVGAFAALAYSQQITYTSQGAGNWRMSMTPDALRQCPVTVEELPYAGAPGLTVQLELKPGIPLTEKTIRLARQFYPFTATLRVTQKDGEQMLPPPDEFEPQLSLLTSAGCVEWSNAWPRSEGLYEHQRGYACEAVWEYKRFASPALRQALRAAAEPRSSLAKVIAERSLRWSVDPASGVRPKLPDRNELLDDECLAQAAGQLLDALEAWMLEEVLAHSAFWPDRLPCLTHRAKEISVEALGDRWPRWLRDERVMDGILPQLGWLKVAYENVRQLNTYDDGEEGLAVETESEKEFDRRALPVASRALVLTLNHLDIPAALADSAAPVPVTICGFRYHPQCPHVALCDAVTVNGVGLPFVLAGLESDGFDFPQDDVAALRKTLKLAYRKRKRKEPYASPPLTPSVIFAGDAGALVQYLREGEHRWTVLNLVAQRHFHFGEARLEGWVTEDNSDFDWDAIIRALTMQVSTCFDAEMAVGRSAYYALQDAHKHLCGLSQSLDRAIEQLTQSGDPPLVDTLQELQAFARQVEHHQALIGEREQVLGSRTRLLNAP